MLLRWVPRRRKVVISEQHACHVRATLHNLGCIEKAPDSRQETEQARENVGLLK